MVRAVIARAQKVARRASVTASTLASRLRPAASARPPADRTVLELIATRRPWGIALKAARFIARARIRSLMPGVTIVIVNWNTRVEICDVLDAVERFTASPVSILVIDNGSTDGSREVLSSRQGIRLVALPANAGHGVALDLGMYLVRTSLAVTLDSDAFPFRESWLDAVTAPLTSGGAELAGLRSSRGFVHPVLLGVQTAEFIRQRWSFQVHWTPGVDGRSAVWGTDAWDTGELMTQRVAPSRVAFIEPTANIAQGLPGMTVGDVVYHHGGVSRSGSDVSLAAARLKWKEALALHGVIPHPSSLEQG